MGPYFNGSSQSNKPIQFRQALASPTLSLRYTRILLLMIKYFLPPTPSKQNPKKKYKLSLEYDHSFFGHVCVYKRIVNLYFPKIKYLNYGNDIQANSKG